MEPKKLDKKPYKSPYGFRGGNTNIGNIPINSLNTKYSIKSSTKSNLPQGNTKVESPSPPVERPAHYNKRNNNVHNHHNIQHQRQINTNTSNHAPPGYKQMTPVQATHHTVSLKNKEKEKNNNIAMNALINTKSVGMSSSYNYREPVSPSQVKTVAVRNKNEEAINDLRQRIPEIANIFDVHSRIGNGTFSTVLLGTLKKERELPESLRRKFAIKHHIPTSHPERIMKELQCMARIGGSDNVVSINCCIRYNESVAFIMPYMPHDRFHDFFGKMDLGEVQHYMKNLLIALRHVHKFQVIHRDVKPSNFLYNRRKRQFLLVDFGLAQQVPTPQTAIFGNHLPTIGGSDNGSTLPLTNSGNKFGVTQDGKRLRNTEETAGKTEMISPSDITGAAKRLRCSGPQGDNNAVVPQPSPFKMPLKQINEISTPKATGSGTSVATLINDTFGTAQRNQTKQQQQANNTNPSQVSGNVANPSTNSNVNVKATGGRNSINSVTSMAVSGVTNNATNSKCYCYGNPQVCNICLIKKEIHASRAGTPGYRPPEVLLKYPDQTTAVDVWAAGVIFLSILSSVYPFFKAPNDFVALAEMVTIFGDRTIRKTAFILDRLVTLSQKTKPLDLRKLCVRFRNRSKFSSPELLRKYQNEDGTCEVCKNCDQFYFNCLCVDSTYETEPFDGDDVFPAAAYDLLYKLLEVNPHKRITAEEALEHPFFQDIPEKDTLFPSSYNNAAARTTASEIVSKRD